MGIKTNGYLDHQWYDHINIVKSAQFVGCGKPKRVCSAVRKWTNDKWKLVWKDELIIKCLPLDLHVNKDVFTRYLNECLLEGKQIPTCVSDPLKKPSIGGKIEPLGSQKVGHESGHLGVTWFRHLVVPFGTRKCQFQHVLLYQEEWGDHPTGNK
jgi:hypothetical protein